VSLRGLVLNLRLGNWQLTSVALLLCTQGGALCAQRPQAATASERCERAIRQSDAGDLRGDVAILRQCGERGAAAVARLLRSTSRSAPASDVTRAADVALGFRDAEILRSALRVAGDRRATTVARVQSMRVLISLMGGTRVTYASLSKDGSLCGLYSGGGHNAAAEGKALPPDLASQIRQVAEGVNKEKRLTPELASASECVSVVVEGFTRQQQDKPS
jgi:hypothetical protein